MKRQIRRGFPERPPVTTAVDERLRVGDEREQHENIFEHCRAECGNFAVKRMDDGKQAIAIPPSLMEYYGIHEDPWRWRCYATEDARWMYSDDPDTEVWSWTASGHRNVILWEPKYERPPRFEEIGSDVIEPYLRKIRNSSLTMTGRRLYFSPILGVMYVGVLYR